MGARFSKYVLIFLLLFCGFNVANAEYPVPVEVKSIILSDYLQYDEIRKNYIFDPVQIAQVKLEGDQLHLVLTGSGGCRKDHEFDLIFSKYFMESSPLQVAAFLSHNSQGDSCERLMHWTAAFDLTPLKELYQKMYRNEKGTILLGIEGWDEKIFYKF